MKKIIIGIVLLYLISVVSCAPKEATSVSETNAATSEAIDGYDTMESKVTYSNLLEQSSQDELKESLLKAGITKSKVDHVIDWIINFNELEKDNLTSGYQTMDDGYVSYNHHTAIGKAWKENNGDYEDLYCRIVAFYLMEDFISVENILPDDEMYLTRPFTYEDDGEVLTVYSGDKNVIDHSPMLKWSSRSQSAYYTLFNPIGIEEDFDVGQRAAAIIASWNKRKITFTKGQVSLVTIWNELSSEANTTKQIFAGHAGVLIDDKDSLLFFEKTNPLFPYQVTKFQTKEQLKDYLIATVVAENRLYGEETGIFFVMENNNLIE